jgi:adenylosuccinate synthase
VAARYAARVSGSTELAVMLLDVVSGIDELRIAVSYNDRGTTIDSLPSSLTDFENYRPNYETLPGWQEDLTQIRNWSDLPKNARNYIQFLGSQVGVPVSIVSVGPERKQTILVP